MKEKYFVVLSLLRHGQEEEKGTREKKNVWILWCWCWKRKKKNLRKKNWCEIYFLKTVDTLGTGSQFYAWLHFSIIIIGFLCVREEEKRLKKPNWNVKMKKDDKEDVQRTWYMFCGGIRWGIKVKCLNYVTTRQIVNNETDSKINRPLRLFLRLRQFSFCFSL